MRFTPLQLHLLAGRPEKRDRKTHNQGHPCTLQCPHQHHQSTQNLPPRISFLLAPQKYHHKRNKRHTFNDDSEIHQKAGRAPHGAEIAIATVAILAEREVLAGVGEG